jgi:hypothetical protein
MSVFSYIGPGAGLVISSSVFFLAVSALVGAASLAVWPLRAAWQRLRRRQG